MNLLWQQKQPTYESVNKLLETRSSVIAEKPCSAQRHPNLNLNHNPNWSQNCSASLHRTKSMSFLIILPLKSQGE